MQETSGQHQNTWRNAALWAGWEQNKHSVNNETAHSKTHQFCKAAEKAEKIRVTSTYFFHTK